mgnify:FL=1
MVYVIDKKGQDGKNFTDFGFNCVSKEKRAEWHSREDAYYGISCFIKDNHPGEPEYSVDRYEIVSE